MSKGSINKVIIIGNIGKDPETQTLPSGTTISNFSVATTEHRKDKEQLTEWHRILAFGKLAEIVKSYCLKGQKVYIEGKLQTRKWTDKQGIERYSTEILANEMQILSGTRTEKQVHDDGFTDDQIPF